jgi:CRISPR-associated protein Csc3
MRILNRPPRSLDERYFSEIRPLLYERHGSHAQWGKREKSTLADHLDSACQFVLTVSKLAKVPDDKRGVILAATAVHDLNKLDKSGRNVKTLARDKQFLQNELDNAGVHVFIQNDEDLELARKLIERHSGHNVSDGTRFLPEDPNIERWASILRAADLFDLELDEKDWHRKVTTELVHALGRPSNLYRVRISEDTGYMTALLLAACEEILAQFSLQLLTLFPDGALFEGEQFPENIVPKIASRWQSKIDLVFGNNIDQLVTATKDGIKIAPQAVQHDLDEVISTVLARLEKKKAGFKLNKIQQDVNKWGIEKTGEEVVAQAEINGLQAIQNDDDFMIAEGLKSAYLSYRQVKGISSNQAWRKLAIHVGFSEAQQEILEAFDPQYGRPLFASKAVIHGVEGIQAALRESLELRNGEDGEESEEEQAPEELIYLVSKTLNLPCDNHFEGFSELESYINANPRQRCSLGAMKNGAEKMISSSMPPGIKIQVFSNRLPGGLEADPVRQAEKTTTLAYQLLSIGANFPAVKNDPPYYLHLSLPKGSCPELLRIWRECLFDLARTNTEGGPVTVDDIKLYRDNAIDFKKNKVVGIAFPKRPEFIHNTVTLPMMWGEVNSSTALLKSLRLALELSLSLELGFPFVLTSSLQIKPSTDFYGRIEGIPTSFSKLLGSGCYSREEAIIIRDRLRCLGSLVQAVASIQKFDDCLYDLARATTKPFSLYYVLLRWILREQDEPNLETNWRKISNPLNNLLNDLMSNETSNLTIYLREAAELAAKYTLRGSSFRRTAITEPFSAFLSSIRSMKSHMDLDFVFASLIQSYHTRLDRIREEGVGKPKFEQLKEYYGVLRKLYEEVYNSRPEKLLNDRENLEAAYLFFWQEAYQTLKDNRSEDKD